MSTGPFNLFSSGAAGSGSSAAGGPAGTDPSQRRPGAPPPISLEKLFDRPPPYSPEAEMALLGAMLIDPQVIHEVITVVKSPDAFFNEAHAAIFDALLKTYDQKQTGDLVLIIELLRDKGQFKDIGGVDYLEKLMRETPGAAAALHYARVVADKARLRRLITASGQILYEAYNHGGGADEGAKVVVDRAESLVFDIAQERDATDQAQPVAVLVEEVYQKLLAQQGKGLSGIATGFHDLDSLTSGLQKGEMIIIAARPSMGKSALALNLAEQMALGGAPGERRPEHARPVPVAFFSLEMSKASLAERLLSARCGLSSHHMRSGRLSESDIDKVCEAVYEISEAKIYIDDTPGMTVLQLRTRARRLVSQHGVEAIIVDYLQLMSAPQAARESRQVEVSAISRGIKALARELNIPVICLSQLNRGPEARGDNRPKMSDLRESGAIEQDADVVMLLHREAYYHIGDKDWEIENEDKLNIAEIIVAKQRNGPTDTVKLRWDRERTRFQNLAGGGHAGPRTGSGAGAFGAGVPRDEFKVEVRPFAPGARTGPVANHRDGGGPDRDDPPFDDSADVGLPL